MFSQLASYSWVSVGRGWLAWVCGVDRMRVCLCVHACVLGPGRVCLTGADVWSPREGRRSLRTGLVSPPPPPLASPDFPRPWTASRASGDQRVCPLSCPDAQAHWRGYRLRKAYLERLRYFRANSDAVIKVAATAGEGGSCLLKGPLSSHLATSGDGWTGPGPGLAPRPGAQARSSEAACILRSRPGPGCGQLGGDTGDVWDTSRRM